jgi:hypothetical protein
MVKPMIFSMVIHMMNKYQNNFGSKLQMELIKLMLMIFVIQLSKDKEFCKIKFKRLKVTYY